MNPFDIKEALLAKHAQHVVLIHFPIALFIVGVVFDVLALRFKKLQLAAAAYCNFAVAAIMTLPAVATGLLAWKFQLESAKLQGVLLLHLAFAMASTALIWLVWLVHFRARRSTLLVLPAYRLPIEILGVLVIAITGHLGGFVSGINLPG
jgi:uncharacterized membrane protein